MLDDISFVDKSESCSVTRSAATKRSDDFIIVGFSLPKNLPPQVMKCSARFKTTLIFARSEKVRVAYFLAFTILYALLNPMPGTRTRISGGAAFTSTGKNSGCFNAQPHFGSYPSARFSFSSNISSAVKP